MPWDVFRFELELKPTGEVEQYLASVTYELQREAGAPVDTLTFVTQTEGKYLERAPPALPRSQIQNSQGALTNLLNLTNIYCGQAPVRAEVRAMNGGNQVSVHIPFIADRQTRNSSECQTGAGEKNS